MNTLADEFLADLGDEAQPQQEVEEEGEGMSTEELSTDTQQFSQLVYSERLRNMLERVDEALNSEASKPLKISGAEEGEYALVIESNKMAVEIAEEISKLSRFIKEKYKKKFPELESLVLNPLDYARVVLRIGNEMDVSGMDFSDILPAATIMVVTVTATTSSGTPLEESELKVVQEACHLTLTAEEARKKIMEFVESRMGVIAPNLSTIVGSSIAAKMIGAVGGLSNLSKMPSSNIQSLGSTRKHLGGFSAATVKQYAGFIWDCEIILKTPPSLRSKAARVLAGKCTLAARCDAYDEDPSGSAGRDLREEILRKIDKWQEPPPIKLPKPLPAPDDRPKKKRGGKRMRQIKQKYAMTELRKQANRMAFGTEAQETYRNTANTLGMLGVTGGGKVRLSAVDKGILKKQKQKSFGSSGATSGLSSSLAFTPVQGLELSNPDAAQKVKQANEKYFGISTFARVNKTS